MKYLKLFMLLQIFCNLPSYSLVHISAGVGRGWQQTGDIQ